MKRFITISLIILIVVAVLLGGAWFFARRAAIKNGGAPLSFREFLSGKTTAGLQTPVNNGLGSVFVDNTLSTGTAPAGSGINTPGTLVSQFTNNTSTPTQNGSTNDESGSGQNSTSGNGSGSGSNTGNLNGTTSGTSNQPATPGSQSIAGANCTDADLNITFTPDEQAKLQALQTRFYAVAQTLHTDADVATEVSNYEGFVAKEDKLSEYLMYCKNNASRVAAVNPLYARHVPTPFWYEPNEVRVNTLDDSGVPLGFLSDPGPVGGLQASQIDKTNGIRGIEQVLRLNFW